MSTIYLPRIGPDGVTPLSREWQLLLQHLIELLGGGSSEDTIQTLRGTSGSQPAANAVPAGTLYFQTNTGVTQRSDGVAWQSFSNTGAGSGDVVGPSVSVASQGVLFDGTTGKLIKAATGTGVVHRTSGVDSVSGVVESDLSLSNNTTANTSTTKHGFAPILPNDGTLFLNGLGAYTAPTGTTPLLLQVAVTLTDAQVKAAPTTPVVIVAGPPGGFRIKLIAHTIVADVAAAAYTNVNATYCDLHLLLGSDFASYGPVNDSTTTPAISSASVFLGATGVRIYDVVVPDSVATAGGVVFEYVQNVEFGTPGSEGAAALMFGIDNNGSGNLTGGNPANSMTHTVYYVIEAI